MNLTIWSFAPAIAAPSAAFALVYLLRRLLKVPPDADAAAVSQSTALTTAPAVAIQVDAWDAIDMHWNPLITRVLPLLVGAAIIFLVAWPFAYVGWAFFHSLGDPDFARIEPPWFGNVGYLLWFGVVGGLACLAIVFVAGIAFTAVYLVGRCIIWPQTFCFESDEEQESEPDDSEPAEPRH